VDHSFSPNGYILRRELITALGLISSTDSYGLESRPSLCSMFGRTWDPTDFVQLKKLIAVCRKNIASLEILADPVYTYNSNGCGFHSKNSNLGMLDELSDVKPWCLRKDVCLFLNFVVSRRNYFRKDVNCSQLRDLFNGLRRSLGKVESWSASLKAHCGYRDGNDVCLVLNNFKSMFKF